MRSKNFFLCSLCMWFALSLGATNFLPSENLSLSYEGNRVTDEGAWCWFADPRALHFENESGTINKSYIGYIDVHGNIKATQFDFLTNKRSEVLIRSYFQPDDHNNPTFLVLPDERVMVFYSRHTDEACFYYRISKVPGDITQLGEEKKIATSHNTTYPSPFILSDDPDNIYLCWRGINWHPTIAKLSIPDAEDNTDFSWGPYQIVQSSGARPYAKYLSNGKDKIYLTYTTGHPDNEHPNFVYFNYIDIKTMQLEDIKGNVLSTISKGAFRVNKTENYVNSYPHTIVDKTSFRNWIWQVAQDHEGKPAIAMVQINGAKTSHDYYYARWTGAEWKKTFLANGGGHFHQTSGLEMCYSGGMALDPEQPNEIYCSVPIRGDKGTMYEIIKYTVNETTDEVKSVAVTYNSNKNNVRPYILPGSQNSALRLAWMHGEYYDWIVSSSRPKGYPTAIHSDFSFPVEPVELEEGLLLMESFQGEVEGTAKTEKGVLVSLSDAFAMLNVQRTTEFTISFSPYIHAATYGGTLFQMGDLMYGVDPITLKPYFARAGVVYNSTNVLATSDCWQSASRGTGGEWYTPEKHKFFNLTFTYNNGFLISYINGLIDQMIELDNIQMEKVALGGFNGWIEDCYIYERVLNQAEILSLTNQSIAYELEEEFLHKIELEAIRVPETIVTDIVLPAQTSSGIELSWWSDKPEVLSPSGIVNLPEVSGEKVGVRLVATSGSLSKEFQTVVMPRNIENNKLVYYEFNSSDVYQENGIRYVCDKSGNRRDAAVYGGAKVNGVLDLSANSGSGFASNGYAIVPSGILENLRSYTFFLKVKPENLQNQPRLYDFGSGSLNSVFGRANKLTAGVKYNGESTKMVDSPLTLKIGKETFLAFTFDAQTGETKIYVDGVETVSGKTITCEPYRLNGIGADHRNYIGRAQWWDTSEASNNVDFCGTIDDFCLFNIALTKEEILRMQSFLSSVPEMTESTTYSTMELIPSVISGDGLSRFYHEFTQEELNNLRIEIINMQGRCVRSFHPRMNPVVIEGINQTGFYLVQASNDHHRLGTAKLVVR